MLLPIIYIFFSSFIWSATPSTSDIELYRMALDHIEETGEYNLLLGGRSEYFVSNEMLSFYSIGSFFMEELDLTIEELNPEAEEVIRVNNDLAQLQRKKPERLKIYFSEMKENTFFAEILLSEKKRILYSDRPHFGQSFVFMFVIKDGEVSLAGIKEIAYL